MFCSIKRPGLNFFPKVSIKQPGLFQVLRPLVHESQKDSFKQPGLSQVFNPESLKQHGFVIETIE